jgi:hypothetical protein
MRLAWVALLVVLGGCNLFGEPIDPEHAGSPDEAQVIALDWLAAVSGERADRGWSLLHPLAQQRLYQNNVDRYVTEAESIDWNEFEWSVSRPPVWDGNYMLIVSLSGSTAPANELADGHLVQLIQSGNTSHEASITVRIDFDGSRGIFGP